MQLYQAVVRPHLESACFWSPRSEKDEVKLKQVQRRATRTIEGMENLSYERRLEELGLFSLKGNIVALHNYIEGRGLSP